MSGDGLPDTLGIGAYERVAEDHARAQMPVTAAILQPFGIVHAGARARHRGRTSWVWDVEIRDDEERLCALGRMIFAVRPR